MKMILNLKPNYKESKEERRTRVQQDKASQSNVYANKKAYKRHSKHREIYDYE